MRWMCGVKRLLQCEIDPKDGTATCASDGMVEQAVISISDEFRRIEFTNSLRISRKVSAKIEAHESRKLAKSKKCDNFVKASRVG
jgi:hypothetical protein